MKNKYIVILLITLVVAASGCVSSGTDKKPNSKTQVPNDATIEKYTLDDGTTCYVYSEDSGYAGQGGMSCNFS